MTALIQNLGIIIGTGALWFLMDYLNREHLSIFKISDFIYLVYLPAGYRLVTVITFGWLGALGIGLAYAIRIYFFRNLPLIDVAVLATLYALAPLVAIKTWEKIFNITPNLANISVLNLFWLSCFSALFNASFRIIFFAYADMSFGLLELSQLVTGNLMGTFLMLYILKILTRIYFALNPKQSL
jgi:hypothetical protein